MVKIDNLNNQPNNNHSANPPNSTKPNSLITTVGQLLPFAPLFYEQFTGQKVPQMSGTIAEIQMTLVQISTNLQTINQRLINLESSATNLTHQFQNLRLTHTKEQKQIEYTNPPKEENY